MIYDITQELFSGKVYPGDMKPEYRRVSTLAAGDSANTTELSMNAHNATHIDAPFHRVDGGKTIEELDLEACFGECEVISYSDTTALTATQAKRILLKDCECIDEQTAILIREKGVRFLGVEGQSVGSLDVHTILLEADIVVLEGAVLAHVPEGKYLLSSAPIKLGGCDGAPCRAILVTP